MNDKEFDPHERRIPLAERRGGGRPLPKPAGGKSAQWKPPAKGTTPADRKKRNTNNDRRLQRE